MFAYEVYAAGGEEIKNLILAEINTADEDLRLLANERAANVKNYLIETGKVEAERLFLIEPKVASLKEGGDAKVDPNDLVMQVDLVIK